MSTSSTTAPGPGPAPVGPTKRWTIEEFDALVLKGIVREGSRTFLWDGEIIEPIAENPPHVNATMNLLFLLAARLSTAVWTVNIEKPVAIHERSKPQPDLTVLRGPRERYRSRVPVPTDVALLVEVSDTSDSKDSRSFLQAYATAGVEQYWVVNILERRVEVYQLPSGAGYTRRTDYGLDGQIPLVLSGEEGIRDFGEVSVTEVLRDSLA